MKRIAAFFVLSVLVVIACQDIPCDRCEGLPVDRDLWVDPICGEGDRAYEHDTRCVDDVELHVMATYESVVPGVALGVGVERPGRGGRYRGELDRSTSAKSGPSRPKMASTLPVPSSTNVRGSAPPAA